MRAITFRRSQLRATTLLALTAGVTLLLGGCSALSTDGTPTKSSSNGAPNSGNQVTPQAIPTVVVLDASDSMNTPDAPGVRLEAAKSAVTALAGGLPADTDFAVVAFGSELPAARTSQNIGCTDVKTVLPLGPLDKSKLQIALTGITAQGFTPIANALTEAWKQLPRSGPASIVVVSDGESTCAPDPCQTSKTLHSQRPDVTISAVGFRTDAASLQCVATEGGGIFITADNAAQLSARLAAAQNADSAATRLSTTSRGTITLGDTLDDIRKANPGFPSNGTKSGDRTIYLWEDCTYGFDGSGKLIEIAPGNPAGSSGVTIDGVGKGTPGSRAIELYGEPLEDKDSVATFPADVKAGTAYKLGYEGGKGIKDGTVTTVILCGCLPSTTGSSTASGTSNGPEVVNVVAVDKSGNPINGFTVGPAGVAYSGTDCYGIGAGASTAGVYQCGSTADASYACWPGKNGTLLCAAYPFDKKLTPHSFSGSLPTATPKPNVDPWALELVNGAQCLVRVGGAWPFPPTGYDYGYGCSLPNKEHFFVYKKSGADLFNKSGKEWTVFHGEDKSTPTPIAVKKIFYSAAEK
ncbi:vWA domain-containing protein [Gordonia sp. (in: high G+C Gram-positive bacteria)]|uniref:vWA domain-containing protein n=1 Tax=Gordonia sp. (in: high G+C Gram-positive bacteria) TaxID=84139 RepID=UPI003C712E2C